jgi:hypothetical protein
VNTHVVAGNREVVIPVKKGGTLDYYGNAEYSYSYSICRAMSNKKIKHWLTTFFNIFARKIAHVNLHGPISKS